LAELSAPLILSDKTVIDTAIVLAGGKGTRLYPYTVALPKPLLPVGETPILEILLRQLSRAGFRNVILAVNHQADIIRSYFSNGERFGLSITYSLEKQPLSTMAPLKLISNLPNQFLVMNGDILSDINFKDFAEQHEAAGSDFSVAAYRVEQESRLGVLTVDRNADRVIGFAEKPKTSVLVSMGIYAMGQRALELVPEGRAFGFDDLMMVGLEQKIDIRAIVHDGYWRDLGTPEDYQAANREAEKKEVIDFI
jgi:NDP-mannose synthase